MKNLTVSEYTNFVESLADSGNDDGIEILRAVVGLYAEYQEWAIADSSWLVEDAIDEASDVFFWMVQLRSLLKHYEVSSDIFDTTVDCQIVLSQMLDLAEKQSRSPKICKVTQRAAYRQKISELLYQFVISFNPRQALYSLMVHSYNKLTSRYN
jgi:hypothetical protein